MLILRVKAWFWQLYPAILFWNLNKALERKWRSTRSQSDRQHYVNQCGVVIHHIVCLKTENYTKIITQHSSDQTELFNTVNKLFQKSSVRRYPASHTWTTQHWPIHWLTILRQRLRRSISLSPLEKMISMNILLWNLPLKAQKFSVFLKELRKIRLLCLQVNLLLSRTV